MSVVISSALAATSAFQSNDNTPLIGYENLVTTSNISSTTETSSDPVTNLANPSTHLVWTSTQDLSPDEDEYVTVDIQTTDDVDYVAIARHNLGTAQAVVSVEGLSDESASPTEWEELVGESMLADDKPAIFRFTAQALAQIRLRIQAGTEAASIGVMYVGKLLLVQRNLYVGHTPITYGRKTKFINARSESGNFLGRVKLNQRTVTSVELSKLTATWYRNNFDAFVKAAETDPFFFAWRPGDYEDEVGFVWLTDDPVPRNELANGMMAVSFDMTGIVT